MIRAVHDTCYPEVDAAPQGRISTWLVLEPYNFYHGGLEVILSIRLAAIDDDGNWAFVEDGTAVDQTRYRVAKVWYWAEFRGGIFETRSILRETDPTEDRISSAHSWMTECRSEELVAVELGDDYDWPLDSARKRSDLSSA